MSFEKKKSLDAIYHPSIEAASFFVYHLHGRSQREHVSFHPLKLSSGSSFSFFHFQVRQKKRNLLAVTEAAGALGNVLLGNGDDVDGDGVELLRGILVSFG